MHKQTTEKNTSYIDVDRLKHSIAVARKMMEIGKRCKLSDKELQELFVLGLNHDIGYEFTDNEDHGIIGGNILKESNYKYWKEVYNHGNPDANFYCPLR
jgi:predicted hydrolase (HD superfamily)